jgi:type I restriction enzyme, S subunit
MTEKFVFPEVEICQILEKVTNPVKVEWDRKYVQIGIRSHGKGLFDKEEVTGKELGNKRVFWVEPDCFVVNIVFAWEQAVGRTTKDDVGKIASHRFPMYRPKNGKADVDFISYLFKTKYGKELLTLASPGGAGRNKTLGQSEFAKLKIRVPSDVEQKKIAEILKTWDEAINTVERLIVSLNKTKIHLLKEILDNNSWILRSLGEFGTVSSAGVDKKINEGETPVRLLNYTDVFKYSFISNNDLSHWVTAPTRQIVNCDIRKGDVFFTPSSETREDIAHSSVALEDISNAAYSYHIVRFRIREEWDLNFKAYAFKSSSFLKQAQALCAGSGQRYVISQRQFESIKIRVPPYEEQIKIGVTLKSIDDQMRVLNSQFELLKQEKSALMQQLLTGKRRVKINKEDMAA